MLIGLAGLLAACVDAHNPTRIPSNVDRAEVTEDVAALMTPDGRFIHLATMVPSTQLSDSSALAIAQRYVSDMARMQAERWSREHGAAIDPKTIHVCDRALYAATPYASINGATSEGARRRFDAHWVVPICSLSSDVQVVVSFSALATELADSVRSLKSPMPWERADILSFGVPDGSDAAAMFSPEGAVHYAYGKTGKRISSVPEFVMAPNPSVPSLMRWRVNLESPVVLSGRSSRVSRGRSQVFVGFGDTYMETGLLDFNPQASGPRQVWRDLGTKAPINVVLKPEAPAGLEFLSR